MDTTHETYSSTNLVKQCHEAQQLAETGQYSNALGIIRTLKAVDPKNIFFIALEKQLEKLLALLYNPSLSDPTRQEEILQSIPNLVQRAAEQMQKDDAKAHADESQHADERQVALTHLKNSYFQIADRHLQNREYLNALDEIKRVLILEPENPTAREYQQRIHDLIKREKSEVVPAAAAGESIDRPKEKQAPPKAVAEPAAAIRTSGLRGSASEQMQNKSDAPSRARSSKLVLIISIVAVAVTLGALYFFFGPSADVQSPPSEKDGKGLTAESNQAPGASTKPENAPPVNTTMSGTRDSQKESSQSASPERPTSGKEKPVTQEKPVAQEKPEAPKKPVAQEKSMTHEKVVTPQIHPDETIVSKERNTSPVKDTRSDKTPAVVPAPSSTTITRKVEAGTPSPRNEEKPPSVNKLEVVANIATATESKPPARTPFAERKPEVVRLTKPQFPEAAQRAAIEGEVVARVLIDTAGRPVKAKIVSSSNSVFNDAVIEAVMHSQYSPGVMPSGPVTTWLSIPFTFKRSGSH